MSESGITNFKDQAKGLQAHNFASRIIGTPIRSGLYSEGLGNTRSAWWRTH